MIIFATETSCDETSVCILNKEKKILSHIIHTQKEHGKFGGVVPEIASRSHLQILQKITKQAFYESNINIKDVNLFCSTSGPGLMGGLLVGTTFTKSLAIGCGKPYMPINHLEGHILSPTFNNIINYPYICFLLTGGHTQLYLIRDINKYEMLGETLDDAIGEAFDKVAKLLGQSYPGGPIIEKKAKKGDDKYFDLPHPLNKKNNLNFSFSGIKTAVNLIVKKNNNIDEKFINNMSASFQKKISDILENKLHSVMIYLEQEKIKVSQISIVGGVASNKNIFYRMEKKAKDYNCSVILPPDFMFSDNAAMIAWVAMNKYTKKFNSDLLSKPNPRLSIDSIKL